jgi:hypothetical protein
VHLKPNIFGIGLNLNAAINAAGDKLAEGKKQNESGFFRLDSLKPPPTS